MEIKHKSFGYSLKAANSEEGILEAIVNTLQIVDRTTERTMPGIFSESLKKKLPRGVWHHDWSTPIAKTMEAKELPPGDPMLPEDIREFGALYIKAQFFKDIDDSWQAFQKIKNGLIDEFSIGYSVSKTAWDEETEVLDLLEGEWYEWSPVLVGANQKTTTLSIKDLKGSPDLPFEEHSDAVLDAVDGFVTRYQQVAEKRLEAKPRLSQAHADRLKAHIDALGDLLSKAGPAPSLRGEFDREFLAIQKRRFK
jgi:HK97 family phage prohead protease